MKNFIKKLTSSYATQPWHWMGLLVLTLVLSFHYASHLKLQSDFKYLLPQDKPSVVEINRVVEKVGGIGNLMVVVESDNYKATEKFIDDLVPKLKELPRPYVRYIDYNTNDIRAFYEKNKYLYIDLDDLKTIHTRLKRKIEYEKNKQNPFFFDLDNGKVDFDVSDIEQKYKSKTKDYDNYVDGYYFSKDRSVAVILIQPFGTATGTKFSKELIAKIDAIIKGLDPAKYDSSLRVEYRGKYKRVLDEYEQIIKDMLGTLAICLLLVAVALYLYFFRFRIIFLLSLALAVGCAWTFAVTQVTIGYLNSQTAFLGSIIIGNGVNTGIVLLARYFEERRKNILPEQAMTTSIQSTYLSTFIAAMTTCFSFSALHFSQIKGLSQFGFIGSVGMSFCWLATYLFIPPFLILSERILPMWKKNAKPSGQWESIFTVISKSVMKNAKAISYFAIFGIAVSITLFIKFAPNALEYDFSKLQNKFEKPPEQKVLDDKVDGIFPQSLTPSVMLLENSEETIDACEKIMHREDNVVPNDRTIESCKTLADYLPTQQSEKLVELKKLRHTLQDNSLNFVKGEHRKVLDEFRKSVDTGEVAYSDIPSTIQNRFRELDGTLGRLAYIFPRADANLSNGRKLIQFSDAYSNVRLNDGSVVRSSGESAIFADILQAIRVDGPKTTTMAFIFVTILVMLMFRHLFSIFFVLGNLVIGIILMLGIEAGADIKLNFFNFIALPVTFGIGVDYGVNLFQRYRQEGKGSIQQVVQKMGGAITLCSITTIIGYASLAVAANQALVSFGWLGLIGEVACIGSTMLIMPALVYLIDTKIRKRRKT